MRPGRSEPLNWRWLPLASLALPAAAYLWFLGRFSVNVPFEDEWTTVGLLRRAGAGRLTLAALWAPHNENRMLVPRLLVLALAGPTHFDTRVEMWLGSAFLFVAIGLLLAVYARSGGRSWWWMVPPGALLLSWVQFENILWGFQIAWYLILLALFLMLTLLVRPPRRRHLAAAAVCALVASLSSLQGLFLWPCGLVMLSARGVERRYRWWWLGAGLATTALYFAGYHAGTAGGRPLSYGVEHPVMALDYLLVAIGGFVPGLYLLVGTVPPAQTVATGVVGAIVLAAAAAVTLGWVRVGRREPDLQVAVALFLFAALFDAALVVGRLGLGVAQAAASRYTTYDLLWPVGIWLGLAAFRRRTRRRSSVVLAGGLAALVCFTAAQMGLAYRAGLPLGTTTRARRLEAAEIVANFRHVPDVLRKAYVYPAPSLIRADVAFLAAHHLSLFAGASARRYREVGVEPGGFPGRLLPRPRAIVARTPADSLRLTAWTVLSTLVEEHPTLRDQFPTDGPHYPRDLLAWATGPGLRVPWAGPYLVIVRPSLLQLRRAVGP